MLFPRYKCICSIDFLKDYPPNRKYLRKSDLMYIIKMKNHFFNKGFDVALFKIGEKIKVYRNKDDKDTFRIPGKKTGNMIKCTDIEFCEYYEKGEERILLKEWKHER